MPKSVSIGLSRSQGKLLAVGIVLIGANLRAPITGVGPVLSEIQASLQIDSMVAGALNALPLLIFALLSILAPAVGRRIGLERTLGASLAAIAIGTIVRSVDFSGAIWIGTVILSIGIAFGNVLLPGLVKRDVSANAAGLIGLYAAAMAATAGLAAGAAVPIANIPPFDWRWAIGIWAVFAVVALLVWSPQMAHRQRSGQGPETAALQSRSPWRHAIGWQVSIFFACHSLVFYSLVDWFAVYARSVGIGPATAGFYLLIYQVVAIITNLACASLIRRAKDQTLLGLTCGLFLVVASIGLYAVPAAAVLWIVSAGLGAGLSMTTSLSLFGLRTRDHHAAARLSGMAQFIGYIGAAAGPLVFGFLHGLTGAWNASLVLLIGASLMVTAFAALAGRDRFID